MGGYHWLAALVGVASLLMTGQCDVGCKGADGAPGVAGVPGRDGWPGLKGDKGEPAVRPNGLLDQEMLLSMKGEMGIRGIRGIMGPKGYTGNLGAAGLPGMPGPPGPGGKSMAQGQQASQQASSAFSAIRTDNSYPRYDQVVTYQTTAVNRPQDFSMATGHFTCRTPGFYYFTFHSKAKVSMCLRIASEALQNKLGFCDYNHRLNDQVLSGGVVLELRAGQKVWLESFKDQQADTDLRDTRNKLIIFNGFLLFSNPE